MNNLIKDKIRVMNEKSKSLDLKKENVKDKIEMQENFINELEERGNANINANNKKITTLDKEVVAYMKENSSLGEYFWIYQRTRKCYGCWG